MWQKLRALLGQSSTPGPVDTEPVVVATYDGPIAAEMTVAQLHEAGIPAAVLGGGSAAVFGVHGGMLAEVRVLVPAAHADAARALIAELAEESLGTPDDDDTTEEPA